jgi:hypothetical protein
MSRRRNRSPIWGAYNVFMWLIAAAILILAVLAAGRAFIGLVTS